MARNTLIFTILLAVFAAIVVGVNLGRMMGQPPKSTTIPQSQSTLPSPTPTPKLVSYTSTQCAVQFSYPETLTNVPIETGGATFINIKNPAETILLLCQKNAPKPSGSNLETEQINVGSISGTLYTEKEAATGSAEKKLLFRHPSTKEDIYFSAPPDLFNRIVGTIQVLSK